MSTHQGDLIRAARKRLGLSQVEVACCADVSRRTVQSVEAGKKSVKWSSLYAIANVVGVELDEDLRNRLEITNEESVVCWPFGLYKFINDRIKPNALTVCQSEDEILKALETVRLSFQRHCVNAAPQEIQNRFHRFHPKVLTKHGFFDRYLSIWQANPRALSFSSSRGERTGVSIVLPVRESDYSDFVSGKLSNYDISGPHIVESSPTCIFEHFGFYENYRDFGHRLTGTLGFAAFHQLAVLTRASNQENIRLASFAAVEENVERMKQVGMSATRVKTFGLQWPIWELSTNNCSDTTEADHVRSSTFLHFSQLKHRAIKRVRAKVAVKSIAAYSRIIHSQDSKEDVDRVA